MIINSRNLINKIERVGFNAGYIESKELPRFNELGSVPATSYSTTQPFAYQKLIELIRQTPECIGILNVLKTDICSDGFSFEGPASRIKQAEKFLQDNRFKAQFQGVILDWLMLGNGALWKGKINKNFKEIADKVSALTGVEIKETEVKALADEDVFRTKKLKHAAWSTMHIDLTEDKKSIKQFRQIVTDDSLQITFNPEEIIHGKFMEFDGKVYGFSPLEASVNVLSTLVLIKDLNGNFFQNGGVPDWMFILPKEMAGSPNVQKLESVLRKYKSNVHKHGNLVFTGEVEAQELNKFDKDMEFRQLAIYYTGILALAFNLPLARVASILGAEIKSGAASTDLSEAGYWRSISAAQDYWEDLLNQQLFEPEFGVNIKFNRGYLNDEIKEAQRDVQGLEVLKQLALAKAIKPEYVKQKLKIPDQFWTGKFEPQQEMNAFGGPNGSPGSSPKSMQKGDARQANADRKQGEANQAMERKEKDFFLEVGLDEFDRLVQRWVKTSKTRQVNWFQRGNNLHLMISTPDNNFLAIVPKDELSPVKKADWLDMGSMVKAVVPVSEPTQAGEVDMSILNDTVNKIEQNDKVKTDMLEKATEKLALLVQNIEKITKMDSTMAGKLSEIEKLDKKIERRKKKLAEILEALKED